MTTVTNKLKKAGILTKKAGRINNHYEMAIVDSRKDEEKKRIYTFQWQNKGRNAKDTSSRILHIIRALGYKYSFGNDAPKGGKNGEYIQLYSKQAFETIKNLHKVV